MTDFFVFTIQPTYKIFLIYFDSQFHCVPPIIFLLPVWLQPSLAPSIFIPIHSSPDGLIVPGARPPVTFDLEVLWLAQRSRGWLPIGSGVISPGSEGPTPHPSVSPQLLPTPLLKVTPRVCAGSGLHRRAYVCVAVTVASDKVLSRKPHQSRLHLSTVDSFLGSSLI